MALFAKGNRPDFGFAVESGGKLATIGVI